MIYAPVIIYTLNREQHLRRCIESLQKNTYADKTEIYISVDYPPADKYKEGYEKVKTYLQSGITGFLDVHIFFQESNLGPHLNRVFLIDEVTQKYDRYIETEDDSEFSRNFLGYMNKGLELFENEEDIYSITAMGEPFRSGYSDANIVKSVVLPIHGMGTWDRKVRALEKVDLKDFFWKKSQSVSTMYKMSHDYPYLFSLLVDDILFSRNKLYVNMDGSINLCDVPLSIYLAFAEKYCIKPIVTKCRDWGYDGSGINTKKQGVDGFIADKMDEAIDFQYCYKIPFLQSEKDNAIEQQFYYKIIEKKCFVSFFKYFLYRFFGWDWHVTEKIKSIIVK